MTGRPRKPALLFVAAVSVIAGCDDIRQAPKLIEADAESYVACEGLVWVSLEGGGFFTGGGTFKVTFTDANGLSHTLRGLHKVTVTDVPQPRQPQARTAPPEPMTPEEQQLWNPYKSLQTNEERNVFTSGLTADEKKIWARAFIKDFEASRTTTNTPPNPCSAH